MEEGLRIALKHFLKAANGWLPEDGVIREVLEGGEACPDIQARRTPPRGLG